jgi:hypothetical protein
MAVSDISGAYRHDDNPEVVFVFARPSAPGAHLSAIRRHGSWKHGIVMTHGELEDNFRAIEDRRMAAALVNAARDSRL